MVGSSQKERLESAYCDRTSNIHRPRLIQQFDSGEGFEAFKLLIELAENKDGTINVFSSGPILDYENSHKTRTRNKTYDWPCGSRVVMSVLRTWRSVQVEHHIQAELLAPTKERLHLQNKHE